MTLPVAEPVSDQDFQAAADAIAEAQADGADQYSPDLLNQARQDLAQAHAVAASDPDTARGLLKTSIEKAHEARDAALAARSKAELEKLDQAVNRLKALQADLWDPTGSSALFGQADSARAALLKDYSTGAPLVDSAVASLDSASSKLSARLLAVQDLRLQAQHALDAAEKANAYVWVPDLVQSANDAFFQGTGAWKKYQLDTAEEAWNTSLFDAKSAASKAQEAMERKQTKQLMLETMKKLEDASRKTVVDPQDHIILPKPWDGTQELKQLQPKPVSLLIPSDGSVVVLGDKQRVTYLDEAKDQWEQGVRAYNTGDLTLANQSFLQAQKLVDVYLSLAIDKFYTVRLIPDQRDSLWRISGYKEIFGSPWDWPKIWKRNQKLIQNPDLIYPGWQLIIPPQ